MQCMVQTLSTGKGFSLRPLLSISSLRPSPRSLVPSSVSGGSTTSGGGGAGGASSSVSLTSDTGKYLPAHPVFNLSPTFAASYGLTYRKPGPGLVSPSLELNVSKASFLSGCDKDFVKEVVTLLASRLGEVLGAGTEVRIPFGNVGVLNAKNRMVSFNFREEKNKSTTTTRDGEGQPVDAITSWVDKFMAKTNTAGKSGGGKNGTTTAPTARRQEQPYDDDDDAQEESASARPELLSAGDTTARAAVGFGGPSPRTATARQQQQVVPQLLPQLSTARRDKSLAESRVAQRRADLVSSLLSATPVDYSVEKDRLIDLLSGVPVPLFLIPDQVKPGGRGGGGSSSSSPGSSVVKRNLYLASLRLDTKISEQRSLNLRQPSALQEQANFVSDYMDKAAVASAKRSDVVQCLDRQTVENAERRRNEAKERRTGGESFKEGFRAYPIAKPLNIEMELAVKKNLRDSLDEQVKVRLERDDARKRKDLERDWSNLSQLSGSLRKERENKVEETRKFNDALIEHWGGQVEVARRMKEVNFYK